MRIVKAQQEEMKDGIHNYREVYRMLDDDQSKEIFLNKLCYEISENPRYIQEIIDTYIPALQPFGVCTKDNERAFLQEVRHRSKDKKIIVYGAGTGGKRIIDILKGMEIYCFCDKNKELQKTGYFGKTVNSPEASIEEFGNDLWIIGTSRYSDEIEEFLMKQGIKQELIIFFKDYIPVYLEKEQYFDNDIIKFDEEEVFIDGGCYDFETGKTLLEKCDTVKKIYAFEPDIFNAVKCRKKIAESGFNNVELIERGLWSRKDILYFDQTGDNASAISESGKQRINVISLDAQIELDERVTFIKMDIEGAELEALKGAEGMIKKYKPKLAICIYHKREDLIDIPYYIKTIMPEYRLYIRNYCNNELGETVLYAI